ncbi:hypothetical protein FKM82_016361 [Ascaphus truei]
MKLTYHTPCKSKRCWLSCRLQTRLLLERPSKEARDVRPLCPRVPGQRPVDGTRMVRTRCTHVSLRGQEVMSEDTLLPGVPLLVLVLQHVGRAEALDARGGGETQGGILHRVIHAAQGGVAAQGKETGRDVTEGESALTCV